MRDLNEDLGRHRGGEGKLEHTLCMRAWCMCCEVQLIVVVLW